MNMGKKSTDKKNSKEEKKRKKLPDVEKKKLIKKLLKTPVEKLRISEGRISFDFFGHKISDKIVVKYEDHVAEWSRRRREVFIDKELADREFTEKEMEKSFKVLCLHEAVEKFLVEHYHLKLDEEAHVIATQKEKELLEKLKGNWRSHEMIVYWDWHNHGEH